MLQMFVLALSLYNTWNRGVFLLCKITNLLIYRIIVENSYSGELIKVKEELRTTKEDAVNHGIGLTSVRRAVKKYHGTMVIDDTMPERFLVRVVLYGK